MIKGNPEGFPFYILKNNNLKHHDTQLTTLKS